MVITLEIELSELEYWSLSRYLEASGEDQNALISRALQQYLAHAQDPLEHMEGQDP